MEKKRKNIIKVTVRFKKKKKIILTTRHLKNRRNRVFFVFGYSDEDTARKV